MYVLSFFESVFSKIREKSGLVLPPTSLHVTNVLETLILRHIFM